MEKQLSSDDFDQVNGGIIQMRPYAADGTPLDKPVFDVCEDEPSGGDKIVPGKKVATFYTYDDAYKYALSRGLSTKLWVVHAPIEL